MAFEAKFDPMDEVDLGISRENRDRRVLGSQFVTSQTLLWSFQCKTQTLHWAPRNVGVSKPGGLRAQNESGTPHRPWTQRPLSFVLRLGESGSKVAGFLLASIQQPIKGVPPKRKRNTQSLALETPGRGFKLDPSLADTTHSTSERRFVFFCFLLFPSCCYTFSFSSPTK